MSTKQTKITCPEDLSFHRESSLLQGLDEWLPVGNAVFRKLDEGFLLQGGMLEHFLDWDNAEHSAEDCTFPVDRIMRYTVRARGQGTFRLGCDAVRMGGTFNDFTMTNRFTRHTEVVYSEVFTLQGDWQDFTFFYQEKDPGTIGHPRVLIAPGAGAEVQLLSASMYYQKKSDFRIVFAPNAALAAPGDEVCVTLCCERANYPLRVCIYDGHNAISNGMDCQFLTTDANGRIALRVPMASATFEGMRITASDPATGVKKSFFISEVTPEFKRRFEARKIARFPYKSLLFLGDSLTDYDRGRNYVDLVKLLLPEEVSIVNAGVGGDNISRCVDRITGTPCVAPERYDGVFDRKPELVFIFLGANDTHTETASNFQIPLTPPELQYAKYKEFLNLLRERCAPGVKFVFIEHTPGFYADQEQSSRRRTMAGRSSARFNEEKHVLNFLKVLHQVAAEEGADVIPAYSAMLQCENRREFFISNDGIHMTLKGHRMMAGLVMDYLQQLSGSGELR